MRNVGRCIRHGVNCRYNYVFRFLCMSKSYDEDGGVRMKQTCFFDLLLVVLLNETSLSLLVIPAQT
jgi:hypothetical protein